MGGRSIRDLLQYAHPDRESRPVKWANNSLRYPLRDGSTVWQLHNTCIVRSSASGNTIWLNSGGWKTHTTKHRINEILGRPISVYSHKGVWYYVVGQMHHPYKWCVFEYEDGMPLTLYKGIWIPNTQEVLYYCGVARRHRCRPRELFR